MNCLYLLVDVAAVIVPFLFSFHPKINFYKKWPSALPAITLTAIAFSAWDVVFTEMEVWGFNTRYLTGIYVFNLPLEEVLFFICIPYACLFTYYCLSNFVFKGISFSYSIVTVTILGFICIILSLLFHELLYTFYTFLLLGLCLIFSCIFLKEKIITFLLVYIILLLPFFIVNGILTGTGIQEEVVWYNNSENLNLRILTIPVEDIFYGMLLALMNVFLFEMLAKKHANK